MNRSDFFKKLGLGALVAAGTPEIISAKKNISTGKEKLNVAIDIESISHFHVGGKRITPVEILRLFKENGELLYHSKYGNAPIVFNGTIKTIKI